MSTFNPHLSTFYPSHSPVAQYLTEQQVRRIVQEELAKLAKKDEPEAEATCTVTLAESEARELVSLLSAIIDARGRVPVKSPRGSLVAIRAKLETASADA